MDWSRPGPENGRELTAVHGRLRAAGAPEGPAGYDLAALELAAAVLGWVSDAGPAAPFVVVVGLRNELAGRAHLGWGWSEVVAPARALDRALADPGDAPRPS